MSGHSKWHNIRMKKAKADAQKQGVISKALREIFQSAKQGGASPDTNARLKLAVERARDANVSMDSIERAIRRGAGLGESGPLEALTYEVYGPGGAAILIEASTDNRNRTASEIRFICSKHGGRLAESGAVAWQFEQKGLVEIDSEGLSEDDALALAIDAGAEDVAPGDGVYEIYTSLAELEDVRTELASAGANVVSSDLTMIPKTSIMLEDHDVDKMLRFLDALEEQDDVTGVHANFEAGDGSGAESGDGS